EPTKPDLLNVLWGRAGPVVLQFGAHFIWQSRIRWPVGCDRITRRSDTHVLKRNSISVAGDAECVCRSPLALIKLGAARVCSIAASDLTYISCDAVCAGVLFDAAGTERV